MSSFPDIESSSFDNQVISVELEDIYSKPFELGSSRKYWKTNYFFDIFCFNKMLRKSLSNKLMLLLARSKVPLVDFKESYPLNQDGSINENFNMYEDKSLDIVNFGEVSSETLDFKSQNKKEMYHSCIFWDINNNFLVFNHNRERYNI